MVKKNYTKLHKWQLEAKAKEKGHKCVACGREDSLTVDHIIPVFLIERCILTPENRWFWLYENEENFQFMCKYCNDEKKHFIDRENPKIKELLKKLLL